MKTWMKVLIVVVCLGALCATSFAADKVADKRLGYVQELKGHPVHHIMQLGFIEKCKELGYTPEFFTIDALDNAQAIAAGEAGLAKGVRAFNVYAYTPAYYPFIKEIKDKGGFSVVMHIPIAQKDCPGLDGNFTADPLKFGAEAAKAIMKKLAVKKGKIIVSQGGFNTTENAAAKGFTDYIKKYYPKMTMVKTLEEGYDAPIAISRAVAVIQANPDLLAAFSTTGMGPTTWAGAVDQTGKKGLVIIGMDFIEQNVDLVKSGKVYAIVAQPLYEEAQMAVVILDKLLKGEKVPYFTPLEAPIVTKDGIDKYAGINERVKKFDFTQY